MKLWHFSTALVKWLLRTFLYSTRWTRIFILCSKYKLLLFFIKHFLNLLLTLTKLYFTLLWIIYYIIYKIRSKTWKNYTLSKKIFLSFSGNKYLVNSFPKCVCHSGFRENYLEDCQVHWTHGIIFFWQSDLVINYDFLLKYQIKKSI